MEELLDEIEEGKANYLSTVDEFYKKFRKDFDEAQINMTNVKAQEIPTEETCDKCSSKMVIKWGRFGHFLACSAYPECREHPRGAKLWGQRFHRSRQFRRRDL